MTFAKLDFSLFPQQKLIGEISSRMRAIERLLTAAHGDLCQPQ